MKKALFVRIALIFTSLLFALLLCSCGAEIDEEEVIDAAKQLIEDSVKINNYIWGPLQEYDETAEPYDDTSGGEYYPLKDGFPYSSMEELKEAISNVYSEGYCENIFSTLFKFEDDVLGYFSPRYVEMNGQLYINKNYSVYELNTVLLTDTIKIVGSGGYYVVISIDYQNGTDSGELELTMLNEENGWRLDTATY